MSESKPSDPRTAERGRKDAALRAWFDLTTDRVVQGLPLSRADAERYATYVEEVKSRGDFLTQREHYARRMAQWVAARPSLDYRLLFLLALSFFLGMYFSQVVAYVGRLW